MTDKKKMSPLDEDMICSQVGRDLTFLSQEENYNRVYGRDEEIDQILTLMVRPKTRNVIIIGESGVGKTAIVEEIAFRMAIGDVPPALQGKRIIQTTFMDLWASIGAEEWGKYLDSLRRLIKECTDMKAFLFMDEVHTIFNHNVSMSYLRPSLARGELNMLGATTEKEYHTFIARDQSTTRRFQVFRINETNEALTDKIVANFSTNLMKDYGCELNDSETRRYLVQLTNAYIPYQYQPGKSLDILDQIAANKSFGRQSEVITKDDIRKAVCRAVGIPEEAISAPRKRLDAMQQVLNAHILGQADSIAKLCRRLYISKAKVSVTEDRPDGVFFLAGPTGVGKTELAKALTTYLTGSDKHLVRLDMSTYSNSESIHSLIGSPGPQYNDRVQDVPLLTRIVKAHPYSVLLLDEIEKAHPSVRLLFLHAFDTGRMVDSLGNEISLRNMVVIMTTNMGFSVRRTVIPTPGQKGSDLQQEYERAAMEAISKEFPKEFLGRVDDLLFFKPLSKDIMLGFVGQKIRTLEKITGKKIEATEDAKASLCDKGFHPEFGARDLNRAVDNMIGYKLALIKLSDDWEVIDVIHIDKDLKTGELQLTAKKKGRR